MSSRERSPIAVLVISSIPYTLFMSNQSFNSPYSSARWMMLALCFSRSRFSLRTSQKRCVENCWMMVGEDGSDISDVQMFGHSDVRMIQMVQPTLPPSLKLRRLKKLRSTIPPALKLRWASRIIQTLGRFGKTDGSDESDFRMFRTV